MAGPTGGRWLCRERAGRGGPRPLRCCWDVSGTGDVGTGRPMAAPTGGRWLCRERAGRGARVPYGVVGTFFRRGTWGWPADGRPYRVTLVVRETGGTRRPASPTVLLGRFWDGRRGVGRPMAGPTGGRWLCRERAGCGARVPYGVVGTFLRRGTWGLVGRWPPLREDAGFVGDGTRRGKNSTWQSGWLGGKERRGHNGNLTFPRGEMRRPLCPFILGGAKGVGAVAFEGDYDKMKTRIVFFGGQSGWKRS